MIDNKKVILISTVVITMLVVVWGVYSYFTNGVMNNKDIASNKTTVSSSTKQSNDTKEKANDEIKEDEEDTTIEDKEDETSSDTEKTTDEKNQEQEDKTSEKPTITTAEEYVEYTVKQGDTLFSIYKELVKGYSFADTVKLVVEKNKLSSADEISIGKKILIPTTKEEDNSKYVVKLGDTLTTIAKKFFPNQKLLEAVEAIMDENDIENANSIQVGQVLALPVSN